MIGCGVGLRCIGTTCVVCSNTFFSVFIFRIFSGIGAAAFKSTALTLVDLIAPQQRRAVWVSLFYSVTMTAIAIGNITGGWIASWRVLNLHGWRFIFGLEVLLLIPLVFLVPGPKNMNELDSQQVQGVFNLTESLINILSNYLFIMLVFGYSCHLFVRGQISFYVIAFLKSQFGLTERTGGLFFGLTTICAGLIATTLCGFLLDHVKGLYQFKEDYLNCFLALKICVPLTAFATPIVLSMYWWHQTVFLIFLFIAQFTLYAQIGPMVNAIMCDWLQFCILHT